MQEAIGSGSAKTFWQDVQHEQINKLYPCDSAGFVSFGPGVHIPEGDHDHAVHHFGPEDLCQSLVTEEKI